MADRLISADDLIERAYRLRLDDRERIAQMIESAPTVDAEPVKHGRWQVNEMFGYKDMTCLSCGWLFEYYGGLEEEWNYCPHCGAKMDGERREDDRAL